MPLYESFFVSLPCDCELPIERYGEAPRVLVLATFTRPELLRQ